ncbi:MAG: flavodoxin [Actinobacteria bacterium]|nr:MAG: flavodoxin [Actinomycetota bacterium]
MKTLVAYFSQTGNTKRVAEAIYGEIPGEKDIKALDELEDLEGYDLIFYGFPIQAGNPAKDAGEFLSGRCSGKKMALFTTHGAPEDAERVKPWLDNVRNLVAQEGAELLGVFDCQGEVAQAIVDFLLSSDDPERRRYGQETAEAKGLPDEARLERARSFAREIIA